MKKRSNAVTIISAVVLWLVFPVFAAGCQKQGEEVPEELPKEDNPDIFARIYIPDTAIDEPVLQSEISDTYYVNHNSLGLEDENGAVYIELANVRDMCDFNTVLHGGAGGPQGPFGDLYRFADADFFASHEKAYVELDDNLLTYEIFAAFERENTSLLRSYDFTYASGCQDFLDDLYHKRRMGMQLREGWEGITPSHFLITLTTEGEESQYVVVAVLIGDEKGVIDRVVE